MPNVSSVKVKPLRINPLNLFSNHNDVNKDNNKFAVDSSGTSASGTSAYK